jgi:hypothetical protein
MTAGERQRLARILGMLGSEFEGERASAGLQAEAFRKKHGMTWEQMLALPPVEVVVVMKPDPAMAAQQAQWAAEDAARKAAWKAAKPPPEPEPEPPRPDPRTHAPSWAKPNTRPPDPSSIPLDTGWSIWHTIGVCLAPGLYFPYMFVSEGFRLVRWIRLYGFIPWVREKVWIYCYVLTVTGGTIVFLRYVTGIR